MDAVVLERANHFQACAIADVGESRIAVAAEIALKNFSVGRAVEYRAPGFEFTDAVGGFLCMQFGHAPVVDVLAAAHRVSEVHFPVVAVIHVCQGRGHAAFGHYRMRLAQERFANQANPEASDRGFNGCPQPAPPAPMISTSYSRVS